MKSENKKGSDPSGGQIEAMLTPEKRAELEQKKRTEDEGKSAKGKGRGRVQRIREEFFGMNKPILTLTFIAIAACQTGCRYEDSVPFFGYYSKDRKLAIEYPRTQKPWRDPKDGTWYTPVIVHRYGDVKSVETNMCVYTDTGSCGNYALETKDRKLKLEDYSYGNSGDPEAIYTSITFKRNGKDEMIPLERLGDKKGSDPRGGVGVVE